MSAVLERWDFKVHPQRRQITEQELELMVWAQMRQGVDRCGSRRLVERLHRAPAHSLAFGLVGLQVVVLRAKKWTNDLVREFLP